MSFENRLRRLEQPHGPTGCNCAQRRGRQVVSIPTGTSQDERAAIIDAIAPPPCPIHGPCPVALLPPPCASVAEWLGMVSEGCC
jgi:hypothetical protein